MPDHGHVRGSVTTDDVSYYSAVKHEPRSFKTPSVGVEYRPFQHCRRSSPTLSISSTEKSSFLGLWSQSAPCSRHVHSHALLPSTREFHCYLRWHRQQCYTSRDFFHSQIQLLGIVWCKYDSMRSGNATNSETKLSQWDPSLWR